MDDRKIEKARQIAIKKGIINNPDELQVSKAANKRFSIKWLGKTVNFGVWPYSSEGTFIDHGSKTLQENWKKRHGRIKLKNGKLAYKVPGQPEFFSWHILWS